MSITSVVIGGTTIPLADIDYSVAIYHGRDRIDDSPDSSSCEMLIYVDGAAAINFDVNETVVVQSYSTTRFTGQITDITVQHGYNLDGTPITGVSIIAMGNLRLLGKYVDAGSWSAESVQDRVDAILTGTGLAYVAEADPALNLTAYTPGPGEVRAFIDEICEWTGATIYDTPDGRIWFESYTRRGTTYATETWAEFGATSWANAVGNWDQGIAPSLVTLNSAAVVWSPEWTMTGSTIINDVTVTYGTADPQASVNQTDAASIEAHGQNAIELKTTLDQATDATERAANIITAQAASRYQIGHVEVLLDELTSAERGAVLGLKAGARVLVQNLPQPAPFTEFLGVVEGWGELHTPDRVSLSLALSDPRYSYATVQWGEAPAAATWGGVPVLKTWGDIIQPSDLD
jgi:hypothetical protein